MSDPIDTRPRTPEIKSGEEASGGRKGWGVSRILAISLLLAVVVLFGLYALHLPGLSTNHGAGGQSGTVNPADAAGFHEPAPQAKTAPTSNTTPQT